jgi:hypothetical protein
MSRPQFASYQEFFPYYVAMHSKPLTRQLQFGGTRWGAVLALIGLITRRPKMLGLFPLCGYGTAWPAHWLVEKNNPASFGHPLWSLRGDFEMVRYMLAGRDGELTVIARDYLRENAFARTEANYPEAERLVAV